MKDRRLRSIKLDQNLSILARWIERVNIIVNNDNRNRGRMRNTGIIKTPIIWIDLYFNYSRVAREKQLINYLKQAEQGE